MPDSRPSLIDRLKQARIVQVLAVYLGASWAILQIADVLQGTAGLPDWVGAFTLLLLVIGLVVVLATAWVQSLASTTAKEDAGEIPTDWEIAPAEAIESLKSGQLPHLTWGRAVMGGVVALSLLFGGAGVYVVVMGGSGLLGPTEAGADEAAAGIAVLPFDVVGEDLDVWREGMVDVLSTNLDGMGGYRAIDSRTVLARWREQVEGTASPDLETSLRVAGSTGARYGLMGSLVGTPAGVRLNADIYDLSNGAEVAQASTEGPADSVLALVGRMSVDLTRALLAETGGDLIAAPRTASLTTTSLPALRAYLEGEAAFRRSDFAGAVAGYEQAVEIDSVFAMAWYRLGDSYGWLDNAGNEQAREANRRAESLADRLPVRDQILLRAAGALGRGDMSIVGPLRDAARNYPDDPEVWYALGEVYIHGGRAVGLATWADVSEAFGRAVALDPSFSPYQVHWVESAVIAGDTAKAAEALTSFHASSLDVQRTRHLQLTFDLFLTGVERREEVLATLDTVDAQVLWAVGQWGKEALPDQAWVERVARRAYQISAEPWWYFTAADAMLERGRFADLAEWTADPTGPESFRRAYALLAQTFGQPIPGWMAEAIPAGARACGEHANAQCSAMVGRLLAERGLTDLGALIEANRAAADTLAAIEGQEGHAHDHIRTTRLLDGYRALHVEGDTAAAVRVFQDIKHDLTGEPGFSMRWTLAELLAEDRPRDALGLLDKMGGAEMPFARVRAASIHERLGNRSAALEAYRQAWDFLQYADAGEEWAAKAREGIDRLGG